MLGQGQTHWGLGGNKKKERVPDVPEMWVLEGEVGATRCYIVSRGCAGVQSCLWLAPASRAVWVQGEESHFYQGCGELV